MQKYIGMLKYPPPMLQKAYCVEGILLVALFSCPTQMILPYIISALPDVLLQWDYPMKPDSRDGQNQQLP